MKTEELVWDKNQNLIYTDKDVMIQTVGEIILGQLRPRILKYEISQVKGTFV